MSVPHVTPEVLAQLSTLQISQKEQSCQQTQSGQDLFPLSKILDDLPELLSQGNGETIIHIDQTFGIQSKSAFQEFTDKLSKKASLLNALCTCLYLNEPSGTQDCFTGHFLIRNNWQDSQEFIEIRVAVVGNVDSGKSTMLGVLTKGILDDGRGKARIQLFKHKHEIETGRTSSIGQEIMCFDQGGNVIKCIESVGTSSTAHHKLSWEELGMRATKVVNFIDLAGHEKYLKTTMFGLTGFAPDFAMLMVGANMGLVGMTKEHLSLVFALNVPVFIVITKIDMCPPEVLAENIRQIHKLLRSNSCRRVPVMIKQIENVVGLMKSMVIERMCPIFQVSNVSGEGLSLLSSFLNLLPSHMKFHPELPIEFEINEHFSVPGAGTVIAGNLIKGTLALGQTVLLGPSSDGSFITTSIKGIQRKRMEVESLVAGQYGSIALKKVKRSILRKGMVLLGKDHPSLTSPDTPNRPICTGRTCYEFDAEVLVLYHSTTMTLNYQSMLHCGVVRQTASIVGIGERTCLRTGDRAIVRFRFLKQPEFLREGSKLLFREGRTKGVGRIIKLHE